jgi:hypothetical protein
LTDEEKLDIVREIHEVDACQVCHGAKGGVPGNENIVTVDGKKVVMCDYCTSEYWMKVHVENRSLGRIRTPNSSWSRESNGS